MIGMFPDHEYSDGAVDRHAPNFHNTAAEPPFFAFAALARALAGADDDGFGLFPDRLVDLPVGDDGSDASKPILVAPRDDDDDDALVPYLGFAALAVACGAATFEASISPSERARADAQAPFGAFSGGNYDGDVPSARLAADDDDDVTYAGFAALASALCAPAAQGPPGDFFLFPDTLCDATPGSKGAAPVDDDKLIAAPFLAFVVLATWRARGAAGDFFIYSDAPDADETPSAAGDDDVLVALVARQVKWWRAVAPSPHFAALFRARTPAALKKSASASKLADDAAAAAETLWGRRSNRSVRLRGVL
ncbi:hypothetical protein M885DRAFT_550914 [Pelagophyceae sp. CCMP2097]|nr:hypothetical protein M885DRAFT_550914 [Pelagophyceae sp. CCMP2097]|mmetsp:Transcript_13366/g.44716  ORF Transcript_13366/g.44716 Transcript_13366/m.44716 type:complete len:308 (+) Transcript_13366:89-1012(+)